MATMLAVLVAWCASVLAQPGTAAPPVEAPAPGPVEYITAARAGELPQVLARLNRANSGVLVLDRSLPAGPLPARAADGVRIVDMRYNNALHLIRGNHPRIEGTWMQYAGLKTGLGNNIIISDVITDNTPVENWQGKLVPPISAGDVNSQDYANTHNHYQSLLSEVRNFSDKINGVAFWGDSAALTPGARVWGGFLSARSWPSTPKEYTPEGVATFSPKDFDASLIGLEIDVLNGGLPEGSVSPKVGHGLSKVGLQIVGFGERNTAAIEIRCSETDADKPQADRRGVWKYGIISNKGLSADGTFVCLNQPQAGAGLDLAVTDFRRGAVRLKTTGPGSGVIFNPTAQGDQGELFVDTTAPAPRTTVRIAAGGLVIKSADGQRDLLEITPDGKVLAGGRVLAANEPAHPSAPHAPMIGPKTMLWIAGGLYLALIGAYIHLLSKIRRMNFAPRHAAA